MKVSIIRRGSGLLLFVLVFLHLLGYVGGSLHGDEE